MKQQPQTVAGRVIEKCGGFRQVAEWLGLDLTSVYRFTYPRERGGTGGLIPSKYLTPLVQKAQENGIDLQGNDFVSPPTAPQSAEPQPEEAQP